MPFIDTSSDIWKAVLTSKSHDFYHLPEYADLEAEITGGRAIGWVPSDDSLKCEFLIPLISRWIPDSDGLYDLVSPYGYPGILCSEMSDDLINHLLSEFNKEAGEAGYVSTFIRLNPFLNNWKPEIHNELQIALGHTVSLNLECFIESIAYNFSTIPFSTNHKRNLKKLHQNGYRTLMGDLSYINDFIEAYYQTMHRRGAKSYYFFPEIYFRRLFEITGDNMVFISVLSPEGTFESGGIFTIYNGIMQYHLGATVDGAEAASPSKLMMEAAINEGIKRKAKVLHLGGGLGANNADGVYRFKQGFARDCHTFSCLQFIHNHVIYKQLLKENRATGISLVSDENNFFPQYRMTND